MECAKIKELLSDYMDGTLDAQAKAIVEEHIPTCDHCREELVSLKALVQELGSLESVKAPIDFLHRVHERIEQGSWFQKVIRILFVPTRAKIPLQLATAAVTAVLVFTVFHIMQPPRDTLDEPLLTKQIATGVKPKAKALKAPTKRKYYEPESVLKGARVPQIAREEPPIELALLIGKKMSVEVAKAPGFMEEAPAPETEGRALDEDKFTDSYVQRQEPTAKAARRARLKSSSFQEKDRAAVMPSEEKAEAEDETLLPASYFDEALSKVNNLIKDVGGKIISVERAKETDSVQNITAEIPVRNYDPFLEELSHLGVLKPAPAAMPAEGQNTVQVRIQFILSP